MSRKYSSGTFGILQHIIPSNCTYPQFVFNELARVSKSKKVHSFLNVTICKKKVLHFITVPAADDYPILGGEKG